MSVKFTQRALRDLVAIENYIAIDRPIAAAHVIQRLFRACEGLETFPFRGRSGYRLGTRVLTTVRPYLIVYEILANGDVEIQAVWHGAQDRRG